MNVRKFSFNFTFQKDQSVVRDIYNFLEEMFGIAEEKNKAFHPNGLIVTSHGKEYLEQFRIIVTAQQLETIRAKLLNLNVDSYEFLRAIQNHFHPYCYIGKKHHEGTAYENENGGWDVYYTEGTLYDLFDSDESEKYFFSVNWEEICDKQIYTFMCNLFEEKVRELLKR